MQIRNTEHKMRYGGSVSRFPYVKISVYVFHARPAFQITGLYTERVRPEFKKIEAQAYHHRQLGVYAGEIPRDYGVKRPHDGQFAAVFLREIAKCKQFDINIVPQLSV
jgi:hypothetical protein